MVSHRLSLEEGIALGYPLMQRMADAAGIRVLIIKGPTLHLQRIRPDRASSDIDVLVEPSHFDLYCATLEQAGWARRETSFLSSLTTLHSVTYFHPEWPCDVDVHRYFPGFLATPGETFDALWEHRSSMSFGHIPCAVPDRVAGVLIHALHLLRRTTLSPDYDQGLNQLDGITLSPRERAEAELLARRTMCVSTLELANPRLGLKVAPSREELVSPQLRRWRARSKAGSHTAYYWMAAIRAAPWRLKLLVAWRALWPSRADLVLGHPEMVDSPFGRLRVRVFRWGHGLLSVSAAIRARVQ